MQTNFQITVTFCGICEENWDIYRTESLKDLHQKHFSFRILTLLFIISMLFITLRYRYSKENPTICSQSKSVLKLFLFLEEFQPHCCNRIVLINKECNRFSLNLPPPNYFSSWKFPSYLFFLFKIESLLF